MNAFRLMIFSLIFLMLAMLPAVNVYADDRGKRQIDLELEPVAGATTYEIELTTKASGKVTTFHMKDPIWRATIKPGEYVMRMRSYDARNVPGDWSEPSPLVIKLSGPQLYAPEMNAEIKTHQVEKFEVPFKWQAVPGSKTYRVDVFNVAGTSKPIASETFTENEGRISLAVAAKYAWRVTPISESGIEGESQESSNSFTLIGQEIQTPEIERPEDTYVENLKWSTPKFTDAFTYALSRQKSASEWSRVEFKKDFKNSEVDFSLKYPGGHYRLTVQASGPLRENSKPAQIEFDVFDGDRSPAAAEEAKLRQSLEKPTPWYFVASWMVSKINYAGDNKESGHTLNYAVSGGTGRLGLGYISKKSDDGFLGIVDLSGYTVGGQSTTWSSAEFHYIRRYTWGRNMFRPSAGLYYKEIKESENTALNPTTFTQGKVAVVGPHVGFDFWRPFNSKFGMQLNARLYYDPLKVETPNGLNVVPELSYQYGVMGSYKIKPNITGFLGWAHREDHVGYKSTPSDGSAFGSQASPGDVQEISIGGDYFNAMLEWSF